jgi:nicotinate-nucleotide pyrophosphorylase (carboxylating)
MMITGQGRPHARPSGPPDADGLVVAALAEDLGMHLDDWAPGEVVGPILLRNDPTTAATVAPGAVFEGAIVARQAGVLAGLPYARRTWGLLAELAGHRARVTVTERLREGDRLTPGATIADVSGPAELVLAGERTALDFMMVLSGIATEAARWQHAADAASGGRLKVTDTRKTVPGLRALSKYAVEIGGATNHRTGLWDMVLIKDNHLRYSPSVKDAVAAARAARPDMEIEVEADTIEQAAAAAAAGADYVLLDNMDDEGLRLAVGAVRLACSRGSARACVTEASGGIAFERIGALAAAGVDRVSTSALTLAPPLDIALDADA